MLKFSGENAKLKDISNWIGYKPKVYSFSLPSGYTCPSALDCLSKADRATGKITDSKDTKYRCFSASTESMFPSVRNQRWHNFEQLRKLNKEAMVEAIQADLPKDMDILRVHVGGDFFNQSYFDAWMEVGRLNPTKTFYAYTKSLNYWIASIDNIPDNFILNASRGGKHDNLIKGKGNRKDLKVAEVLFSIEEAEANNLSIDHNEFYALTDNGNFALLLHGPQPKGSKAGEAKKRMDKQGVKYSYSRKREAVAV